VAFAEEFEDPNELRIDHIHYQLIFNDLTDGETVYFPPRGGGDVYKDEQVQMYTGLWNNLELVNLGGPASVSGLLVGYADMAWGGRCGFSQLSIPSPYNYGG